jgi:superfamily II DNA or RNA helicase
MSSERCNRLGSKRFDLIIIDEAHHAAAKSYRDVVDFFDAKVVGVTATPDRSDEKALGAVFETVAFTYEILDAIDDGFLVPIDARQVHLDEIDISDVNSSAGDLSIGQLDEAMRKCIEGVVKNTLELAQHRQGLVFWPGVKSAEGACVRFNALAPGSSDWIHAGTPEFERRNMIRRFRSGELKFLHNCGVLTEGFDAPESSLVAVARPTKSRALYAQILGRGLRPATGVIDAWTEQGEAAARKAAIAASRKPDAMILDFVGNAGKHSLSLVNAADVLGGNDPDDVVKIVKKKLASGETNLRAAIMAARKELEEAMKRTTSKVKSRVTKYDPFQVVGAGDMAQSERYNRRFGFIAPTPRQLEALRKFGLTDSDGLGQLSKRDAGKMLDALVQRSKDGLVGFKVLKHLQRFGITDTNIPREKGSRAMDYIAQNGWNKANPVGVHRIISEPLPGEKP